MSSLTIDDVSVDQVMLGAEIDRMMHEPMISSKELADECMQCPSLRARGHGLPDDDPMLRSQDLAEECM